MNQTNSTRMKMTPKYGGPGEATPFRIPFAETRAALKRFLLSRGDRQGRIHHGRQLPKPPVRVTPQKTDYRQTLRALMQAKSDRGGTPPFFGPNGGKTHLAEMAKA